MIEGHRPLKVRIAERIVRYDLGSQGAIMKKGSAIYMLLLGILIRFLKSPRPGKTGLMPGSE